MKKLLILILASAIALSLCACAEESTRSESTLSVVATVSESPAPSPSPEVSEEPREAPLEYAEKLFDGHILEIEITAEERDWAYLMEHATEKPRLKADITIDGVTFESAGVKTRGNSSLSQVSPEVCPAVFPLPHRPSSP